MVDIQVRNLTKFFVIGENLLDNLSFEIQEGERVAILGRNGCGKTTLFNILTGQMDYDSGEVYVNPNKRLGLISQIPKFPAGYTVEDVLRTAYAGLMKLKARMERLEADMAGGATAEQLREYDSLSNRFQSGGGYEMDVDVDKVCNGLGIPAEHAVDLGQVSVALAAHGVGQAALADLAVAAALFGDAVFIVLELQVAGVDQLRQGGGEVEILHAVVAEGQVGQGGEIHRGGHTGHEIEHQKLDVQFIVDEACFCHAIGRSFPPAAGAPAAFIIGNFRTKGK